MIELSHRIHSLSPGVRRVALKIANQAEFKAEWQSEFLLQVPVHSSALEVIQGMAPGEKENFEITRDIKNVYEIATNIITARGARQRAKVSYRGRARGTRSKMADIRAEHAIYLETPLKRRLVERRAQSVEMSAKDFLSRGRAESCAVDVKIAGFGAEPSYKIQKEHDSKELDVKINNLIIRHRHIITVSANWLSVKNSIGDATGVVSNGLILSATQEVVPQVAARNIWRAKVAQHGSGFSVLVDERFICCWGLGYASSFKSFDAALYEPKPKGFEERRMEAEARRPVAYSYEDRLVLEEIASWDMAASG